MAALLGGVVTAAAFGPSLSAPFSFSRRRPAAGPSGSVLVAVEPVFPPWRHGALPLSWTSWRRHFYRLPLKLLWL